MDDREIIPLSVLGAQVQQLKQYPQLTDQDSLYEDWCSAYIELVANAPRDWEMPRTRLPFSETINGQLTSSSENHINRISRYMERTTLRHVQRDPQLLVRIVENETHGTKKTMSNNLYEMAWFVLYLFLTQYGIRWEHYHVIQKRAKDLNIEHKYEQQGLRALLFYDPYPLLRLRHEIVLGLRRMQPFMNFLIMQCLTDEWVREYTVPRFDRVFTPETKVLNEFTRRILMYWLDLAMRLVNIPWTMTQMQTVKLRETGEQVPEQQQQQDEEEDEEEEDEEEEEEEERPKKKKRIVPPQTYMYMRNEEDSQFYREWRVKSKIKRSEYLTEKVRYSLGRTISFYLWFYWEYGFKADERRKMAYVEIEPRHFVLRSVARLRDVRSPTFHANKRVAVDLKRFILRHMQLSNESIRYMEKRGQGKNFSLLLQYVAMAGHFWRITPESTKMHAWVEMNDMSLSIDDKFHKFWQIHYQQMRGFNEVKKALQIEDDFELKWSEEEKREQWVELSPIPQPIFERARQGMFEFCN
jgi:hypothetical protein